MFDTLDTIFVDGRFSRFMDLVQDSGLIAELKISQPMTLFAPIDNAFVTIPETAIASLRADTTRLRAFVRRHFAAGAIAVCALPEAGHLEALDGTSLAVRGGPNILVCDAEVLEGDIGCSNGVVHVVGSILGADLLDLAGVR